MRADARRRLSPEEQDIAHFSRTARALIGRADLTAGGRAVSSTIPMGRICMSIVTSNRAIRTALLVALGTVAWSPMAGAVQKAPPVAGAPSLAAKGFSIIYEFPQNVQNYSNGGVVVDRLGDLFGATYSGGANVSGDVYELTPSGGSYTFADI